MSKSASILNLMANYRSYATPSELNIAMASDAPATTAICAVSVITSAASSPECAGGAVSLTTGISYELTC
ncbi:LxmA leader domain family RiPP [Nocardia sp. KC 131]|uniref:LxmA leader domain family RiPP n=1 Tax=Nocardia arseniciresistens TaxID=3392119 RepID=UPI00398E5C18